MSRIRLTLAYEGTPFQGWQSQSGGNTVQDHLEAAIAEIGGAAIRVHGSGRTDTGVHALGQVAHFDPPPGSRIDAQAWLRALNTKLPAAVRVLESAEVAEDFHARFDAIGKTYRYHIATGAVLHPLEVNRAWHHPAPLDIEALRAACALFIGEHDFAAFAANRRDDKEPNTVRTISAADVESTDQGLRITVSGNGFLYKMVRLLVGGAVRMATGRENLDWLRDLLEHPDDRKCQHCAPGDGLYLVAVKYSD